MSHFLEACCEVEDYCRSTTEFYTSLERCEFYRQKLRDGRYILGLRMIEEEF